MLKMTKFRIFFFLSTLIIVAIVGIFVSYYARGFRLNFKALTKGVIQFQPNGILVIKSEPDGASVFVNGELRTATNATISLSPGTYDVEVKKDGFFTWYKRIVIEKEIVTQANVSLFKNVPSLSPITFAGAANPVASSDGTKIAFAVLPAKNVTNDKLGLWTIDTFSLPLGFSNGPKRITDGDLTNATYQFSPDGRQIMISVSNSIFVLDSGSFTSQDQRINVAARKESILLGWKKEEAAKNASLTRNLPPSLTDILSRKSSDISFSPDEQMILYTASASGTLPENLIKPLPGASTQVQERNIQIGHTYVYDIKEDRNFLITDAEVNSSDSAALRWMPSSRHLLFAQEGQVAILDYDGTNRQIVYSGSYLTPYAFPFTNATKLLILTNLGAAVSTPNLYTLTVK
jgi:WD40 repeat protein